jgi:glycosyltransferase involved in cell wall biosynthesis
MRIGIDASGLGESKTGTAVYLCEILAIWNSDQSINHEFVIFASPKAHHHFTQLDLDQRFKLIQAPNNKLLRSVWQQTFLVLQLKKLQLDVHWGAGFVLPFFCDIPTVVSIYDLTFQLFPEVHERIKRFYFPMMIRAAVRQAKVVIAISETTRNDLYRLLPCSRNKTVITLLAARRFNQQHSADVKKHGSNQYFLFTGTVEPRKNLQRLVAAWNSISSIERNDVKLIIVGVTGWHVEDLIKQSISDSATEFRGFVNDNSLSDLMSNAMVFVYPSLYEGFGLPVLEAMAQGIPVLTSNVGATKEIAEGAALLIDPSNTDSIRSGLLRLLNDAQLRDSLSKKGRERAALFSWSKTAGETLSILEGAAYASNFSSNL